MNIGKSLLLFAVMSCSLTAMGQNYRKMSPHLATLVQPHEGTSSETVKQNRQVLTLMTVTKGSTATSIATDYGCQVVDSVGRIYIVEIPVSKMVYMSMDDRVERLEAEPMPHPAMDVTPSQIDATPVYEGTDLPQAFTGKGVAAGIFDNGFDFTHPAFLDADGRSRALYYYDFCWENDDGTLGHAITTPEEIAAYGHTHHAGASLHGTHVMGIMAGGAVDGKYQGMAPESDLYVAHFNSFTEDFDNPDELTSANCILGFKYLFDQAAKDGKPCVVNFSSGDSYTLGHRRLLESEALQALTGPGRIIVTCAGNDGYHSSFMEKPSDVRQAGAGIVNGVGGGKYIDLDIITPENQIVRFDFLSIRLLDQYIEGTITFPTDSVLALQDTCQLSTTVSLGDIILKIYKSEYQDERGDVLHVHGVMPNLAYLMLCGAAFLLTGDGPAWVYSDIQYSPFVNISGVPAYCHASEGHSLWWPGTLPGLITVGATGYKSAFRNIDGEMNHEVDDLAASQPGMIARFSSRGPTFEGLTKPDVSAPGVSINAAFNSYVEMTEKVRKELTYKVTYNGKTFYYTAQSGTSMSTPVVAGTIALWLQAKPDLTPDEIIDVFAHTCTHPDASMEYPNNIYGHGQIDAYAGLLYILALPDIIPELSTHQPSAARFQLNGRQLNVEWDGNTPQTASISIYTTDGKKVLNGKGSPLDLSSLPAGIYAVQLNTDQAKTSGSTLIRLE